MANIPLILLSLLKFVVCIVDLVAASTNSGMNSPAIGIKYCKEDCTKLIIRQIRDQSITSIIPFVIDFPMTGLNHSITGLLQLIIIEHASIRSHLVAQRLTADYLPK